MTGADTSAKDLAAWDAAACRYVEAVGSGATAAGRFRAFIDEEVGEPAGLRVLDLGCGHGWLTGYLASRDAAAVGVDGSGELLKVARQNHPTVRYLHADLAAGLPEELKSVRFDRVVALMFFMDLPSLDPLLGDVSRCLCSDGKLIVTMTHPAFFSHTPVEDEAGGAHYRRVAGYLQHEDRWIGSFGGHHHYHRPLSWYIDQLAANKLTVTRLHEPPSPPPPNRSESYRRWFTTIPTMLGLVAQPLAVSR